MTSDPVDRTEANCRGEAHMLRVWFLAVHLCKVIVAESLQQRFCLVRTARSKCVLEGFGLVLLELLQNLKRRGKTLVIPGWENLSSP